MYYCVCVTCGEEELVADFERAQEYFNAHAERGCEVEIVNVDVADEERHGGRNRPGGDADEMDARPADE